MIDESEFWARTKDAGDCIEWVGARSSDGYGCVKWDGRVRGTHRVAYQLAVGNIPHGLCVCHSCDNPACVNPDHLFLGSHKDNMADRNRKGRASGGRTKSMAKLTPAIASEIRRMCAAGMLQKDCAALFGIHKGTVNDLVLRKTWADVA